MECHRKGGRLANLTGFYMPGRDSVQMLDMGGWTVVGVSLVSVIIHGLGRIFSSVARKKE